MRYEIGDRFSKKPFAGFIAEAVPLCVIPDYDENREWAPCMAGCDDEDCREFATCEVLNHDGSLDGYIYHVSECQMDPIIDRPSIHQRALIAIDQMMLEGGPNPSLPVHEKIDRLASKIMAYEDATIRLPWRRPKPV